MIRRKLSLTNHKKRGAMFDTGITTSKFDRIVFNPYDLQISIFHGTISGLYLLHICHGPCGNFETLFGSTICAKSLEDALTEVQRYLEIILQTIINSLDDPTSWLSEAINEQGMQIDQSRVMRASFIDCIIGNLRSHGWLWL